MGAVVENKGNITENAYIEKVSLDKSGGEVKLKKESINTNDAIISSLIDGFRLFLDSGRYSDDNFRKYTARWRID